MSLVIDDDIADYHDLDYDDMTMTMIMMMIKLISFIYIVLVGVALFLIRPTCSFQRPSKIL